VPQRVTFALLRRWVRPYLADGARRVDTRRVLPDQDCYEERYRLTGSAVLGLAAGLVALTLGFVWHTQAIFGVLTAVFLVLASLSGGVIEAARRAVAFRADYAGVTLGAETGQIPPGRRADVFVPWSDVEQIVVYPSSARGRSGAGTARCIGIRRREGALPLAQGNEQAPGCPVPGVAAGVARRVTGWHLDRERLAAVTSVVAPGVPIIDVSTGLGPGIDGPGQTTSPTELGPPD
jgi:hypothetical protein